MADKKERVDDIMAENAMMNPVAKSLEQSLKDMQEVRNGKKKSTSWSDFVKDLNTEKD